MALILHQLEQKVAQLNISILYHKYLQVFKSVGGFFTLLSTHRPPPTDNPGSEAKSILRYT